MINFKNKKYIVVRKAISKEMAAFLYDYFIMKRNVAKTLYEENYISPHQTCFGIWDDPQVPNTYCHYADIAMETLLLKLNNLMNEKTKIKLIPTYSFARIYKNGDILHRHKDRKSCEVSTTLNLGGDSWPIYINPDPQQGVFDREYNYYPSKEKGVEINLKPGDMLVYAGCNLEHWREPFEGKECAQVFLHYNDAEGKFNNNIYDSRKMLGLPWIKH